MTYIVTKHFQYIPLAESVERVLIPVRQISKEIGDFFTYFSPSCRNSDEFHVGCITNPKKFTANILSMNV